jgi:hypothetical protein
MQQQLGIGHAVSFILHGIGHVDINPSKKHSSKIFILQEKRAWFTVPKCGTLPKALLLHSTTVAPESSEVTQCLRTIFLLECICRDSYQRALAAGSICRADFTWALGNISAVLQTRHVGFLRILCLQRRTRGV